MLKKVKKVTLRTVAAANLLAVAALLLLGYGGYINPESHPLLASLGLLFPAAALANILFLVFWVLFQWRGCTIPLLGFLLCFPAIRTYWPLNLSGEPPADAIKVLSFNVYVFAAGFREDGMHPTIAYLMESDADIICLQEADYRGAKAQYEEKLKPLYPYYHETQQPYSHDTMILLSRYPIVKHEVIPYESKSNISVAYELDVKGRRVLVVNNHLESNMLNADDRDGFKQMMKGELKQDSAKKESKALLSKLGAAAQIRAPQANTVAGYIQQARQQGMSIIVCGDFNDHPLSYAHHTIARGLTDCYVAGGNGPGFSFNRNWMFVRIDNIFCSDDWEVCGAKVDKEEHSSDHYPIMCWLKKR